MALAGLGIMTPSEILAMYEEAEETVARVAEEAIQRPKLTSSAEVMASIVPPRRASPRLNRPATEERAALFAGGALLDAAGCVAPIAALHVDHGVGVGLLWV